MASKRENVLARLRDKAATLPTGAGVYLLKDLAGRVLYVGKTDSLAGVSTLSGYILDRTGTPKLAFSIIVNGPTSGKQYSAKRLQENICEILIRAVDASGEN